MRKKLLGLLAIGFIVTGLLAVGWYRNSGMPDKVTIEQMANNPANKKAIDSCIRLLQTGDIVLRTGNDMTSHMFRNANTKDKTYSHCGIVIIENGHPFVYHSIGGEDNPDEVLRRDAASSWFSPAHNTGLGIARFNLDSVHMMRLLDITRGYYRQQKKFDLDFDLSNDEKLYCTELVYRALNYANNDSAYIMPTRKLGYTYVATDNIAYSPHAILICQIRYK